jgi:hypothetical protein
MQGGVTLGFWEGYLKRLQVKSVSLKVKKSSAGNW